MQETVTIDPDQVEQASADLLERMEEFGTRTTAHGDAVSNALSGIDIQSFAFRAAGTSVTAFWAKRAQGVRKRLDEAAYFLATHAATARANDDDAAAELVTLNAELCTSLDEYTKADYYAATGARPSASTESPADGGSVAV